MDDPKGARYDPAHGDAYLFGIGHMRRGRFYPGGVTRIALDADADAVRPWSMDLDVLCMTLHPTERLAALSVRSRSRRAIELRSLPGGARLRTLTTPPEDPPWSLTFSADGTRLLGGFGSSHFGGKGMTMKEGSADNTIRIYDVASGQVLLEGGLAARAFRTVIHPDGRTCVVATNGGKLHLYDLLDAKRVGEFTAAAETEAYRGLGAEGILNVAITGTIRGLGFSPDGATLFAGVGHSNEDRGDLGVFDTASRERTLLIEDVSMIRWLDVSPDGEWLLLSTNHTVELWRAR